MRIAILVRSGATSVRRIVLRGGQVAKFGRTDWADFAFPDDSTLSDVHFAIHCGIDTAVLQALSTDRETLVNDQPVGKVNLKHGDLIQAGRSTFMVELEMGSVAEPLDVVAARDPSKVERESRKGETLELAEYIGLSEEAIELAQACESPELFSDVLVEKQLLQDAIRWNAHLLPKPVSVLWGCRCVETQMASESHPLQQTAYKAALQWATDPSEANRCEAAKLAESAKYEGIGGALAAAAGWSGGSMAPVGLESVPPDDRLTGRSVHVSLTLAASLCKATEQTARSLDYLNHLLNCERHGASRR